MGFAMNIFTEALLFAEDLMIDFMRRNKLSWTPATSGNTFRNRVESKFTEAIGNVVSNFSKLPPESTTFVIIGMLPRFSRGYNPRDFLHCCGIFANEAAVRCANGDDEYADSAVLAIARLLKETKRTGEFDKKGGWSAIQQEAAKSCVQWQMQTIRSLQSSSWL